MNLISKIFGTRSDREIKLLYPLVDQINQLSAQLKDKTDDELKLRTIELKNEIAISRKEAEEKAKEQISDKDEAKKFVLVAEHQKLDSILPEAFAMVKEICRRMCGSSWKVVGRELSWEMVPYDVQIIGGIILHRGNVAEMKTGEGKALVAAFPIFLNALTGKGVHLITVNDYLAQRDAEWMGEVYRRLGLSVGFILNNMNPDERRKNYECDVTYGTNNEFGFDYLRDNMSLRKEDQVQREYSFAIVDEVDSVLIDEARTPLIISGAVDAPVDKTFIEGGKEAKEPVLLVSVAAIFKNPWHGQGFVENLRPAILDLAPKLGDLLVPELIKEIGSPEKILAYGKAGIVGLNGEIEHASAFIHTLRFGNKFRDAVGGTSYLSFTNTRGPAGSKISIPMMHKTDSGLRPYYLTHEFTIHDAPFDDEVVIAIGGASSGRAHARTGDRYQDMKEMGIEPK